MINTSLPIETELSILPATTGEACRTTVLSAFHRDNGTDLILFLHGLGCSKNNFHLAWQQPALSPYRLLAVDLPGFGRTPPPQHFGYSMEAYAELCAALIHQQRHYRLHLVAHSMAGAIALLLPDTILDQLCSFTSVEGNLIAEDCRLFSEKISALSYDEFRASYWPTLVTSQHHLPPEAMDLDSCSSTAIYHSARSLFRISQQPKLLQRFLALGDKAHYLYGAHHHSLPVLSRLPANRTTAIAHCGHFPMQENPQAFYAAIADIVARHQTASCNHIQKELTR